jgi:hypothetical protein
MAWRRRSGATLDVVELLQGTGTILMDIDAKLEALIRPHQRRRG